MRRIVVVSLFSIAACTPATGSTPPRQLLADLPIDSLVKSLGPQFASKGIALARGHNDEISLGRFESTYVVEFAAQPTDPNVLDRFSAKLRDVVARQARVTGESSDGQIHHSFAFGADSVIGWIGVVAAKPRSADLDRFVVVVTETHPVSRGQSH